MSTEAKSQLTKVMVGISFAISILGCVQAYANIPYRLGEAEKRLNFIEMQMALNRDLLVRIEERVKWIQERTPITP